MTFEQWLKEYMQSPQAPYVLSIEMENMLRECWRAAWLQGWNESEYYGKGGGKDD